MAKENPVVSVIIPTFNRVGHIEEALNSIFVGNHGLEYEVIVIDDGSTDGTTELIKRKYGDKVLLFSIKHTGKPALARNVGLKKARGKFIAFQDSDDIWINRNLCKEIAIFDDPSIVLTYANALHIDATGNTINGPRLVKEKEIMNGYSFIRKASRRPAPIPTPTVIINKSIINKIGVFNNNLIIGSDTDFWLRISTKGNFHFSDEIHALVRRDGSNISSTPSESGDMALLKHESSRITMFEQILTKTKLTPVEKKVLQYRIAELHYYVAEISQRLGIPPPFDINKVVIPIKPKELQDIDDIYEKSLAGRVDRSLKLLLGWSPKLYQLVKNTFRKVASVARKDP